MKTIFKLLAISFFVFFANAGAQTRLDVAQKQAKNNQSLIVLNFSGSDWCIPCIKLHKNIIETEAFRKLEEDKVIIYINADFPRNKKNQPLAEIKKENATLADKYNPNGIFPYTLLLDENGKILKTWDGLPTETAGSFCGEIKNFSKKHH